MSVEAEEADTPKELLQIISACWDTEKRPTMEQIEDSLNSMV